MTAIYEGIKFNHFNPYVVCVCVCVFLLVCKSSLVVWANAADKDTFTYAHARVNMSLLFGRMKIPLQENVFFFYKENITRRFEVRIFVLL